MIGVHIYMQTFSSEYIFLKCKEYPPKEDKKEMNHQNSKCIYMQKNNNIFTFKNILETILNNSLTCR